MRFENPHLSCTNAGIAAKFPASEVRLRIVGSPEGEEDLMFINRRGASVLMGTAVVGAMLRNGTEQVQAATYADGCRVFDLHSTGEDRKVTYVDVATKGESHGDGWIGFRTLRTPNGEAFGTTRWIVTVLEPAHGQEQGIGLHEAFFLLPKGMIATRLVYTADNPLSDPTKVSIPASHEREVIGGTGVYLGARGLQNVTVDGKGTHYSFDIKCS
jgi:hypothetical protein